MLRDGVRLDDVDLRDLDVPVLFALKRMGGEEHDSEVGGLRFADRDDELLIRLHGCAAKLAVRRAVTGALVPVFGGLHASLVGWFEAQPASSRISRAGSSPLRACFINVSPVV